jgi:hypothetical protein
VVLEKWIEQTAMAVRDVTDLLDMGTMWAVPVGVRWVSLGSSKGALTGDDCEK